MNLFIGVAGDDKMLSRIENQNQKLFLILRSKQICNLQLLVAGCNMDLF